MMHGIFHASGEMPRMITSLMKYYALIIDGEVEKLSQVVPGHLGRC